MTIASTASTMQSARREDELNDIARFAQQSRGTNRFDLVVRGIEPCDNRTREKVSDLANLTQWFVRRGDQPFQQLATTVLLRSMRWSVRSIACTRPLPPSKLAH